MNTSKQAQARDLKPQFPSLETIQQELGKAQSIDDFFGKQGIFAKLFSKTLETLLEAELTEHLGYERYEAKGRNSGNSRNGKRPKQLRTSAGDTTIQLPRDRNSEFSSKLLEKHQTSTNELEEKILAMYGKGMSTRDIQNILEETYGVEVSADTISAITDKVWPLVEAWQNRPLAAIYPIIFLDALHLKLRRQGRVGNVAVYIVLGVDLEGHRDVLGHWIGDGAEGANFWLSVITDLQARGVEDIFIACIDGLTGFKEAIHAVFPQTEIQRCIIHQIRHSLQYVAWKDRKAFVAALKQVYQASTCEEAESYLLQLGETWGKKYAIAVKSWEKNWEDLAMFFHYPAEIRRLIYTTNAIEGYNRGLRKVVKTKASFPTPEAARKLLYLANQNITKTWTLPLHNWAHLLNQLAIRFGERLSLR
jgi:transposase-like protein